jgi:putative SOS response-associated peptidase YedK
VQPLQPGLPGATACPSGNLYSTNQEAVSRLFRVMNRYVGNLPSMPGVFPDFPAPVVRNAGTGRELTMMRWGMPPPPKFGGGISSAADKNARTRCHR